MKKLKRLTLKEVKNKFVVINEKASEGIAGGYDNDCFWRCVSYIETGADSESDAESRALDYYVNALGYSTSEAHQFLTDNGAGVGLGDIPDYFSHLGNEYNPDFNDGVQIAVFNTADNIGGYSDTGTHHAIIITGKDSNGNLSYIDPQNGYEGTILAANADKLTYGGY